MCPGAGMHASWASAMRQMAAQPVVHIHMDQGCSAPVGGRWVARWINVTLIGFALSVRTGHAGVRWPIPMPPEFADVLSLDMYARQRRPGIISLDRMSSLGTVQRCQNPVVLPSLHGGLPPAQTLDRYVHGEYDRVMDLLPVLSLTCYSAWHTPKAFCAVFFRSSA